MFYCDYVTWLCLWCLPPQHHFPFLSGSPSLPLSQSTRLRWKPTPSGEEYMAPPLGRGVWGLGSHLKLWGCSRMEYQEGSKTKKRTLRSHLSPWNRPLLKLTTCELFTAWSHVMCMCLQIFILLKLSCVMFLFFKDFWRILWWGMGTCKRMKQSNS